MMTPREFHSDELAEMLGVVLAPAGQRHLAQHDHIQSFRHYLDTCRIPWIGLVSERVGRITGVVMALLPPGGTAVIMFPEPESQSLNLADSKSLTVELLSRLSPKRLYYAQILREPESRSKREIAEYAGFDQVARLWYLEREVGPGATGEATDKAVRWREYDEETADMFSETLAETYRESRDCPALTGLRPIEDVIAGHMGGPVFNPRLWQLAMIDDRPAGCCLLSRIVGASMIEVSYMGVVPEFRRRGIGGALLARSLEICRQDRVSTITLVVDASNAPAARLYDQFGFWRIATRDAHILSAAKLRAESDSGAATMTSVRSEWRGPIGSAAARRKTPPCE